MKYSAYKQDPHTILSEIKKAFEDEKPYKAQSLCLSYFTALENQRHIDKALNYAEKDNVYNYMVKAMNGVGSSSRDNEYYIEQYSAKTEELKKQIQKYSQAAKAIELFCADNKLDIDAITEKYCGKKIENMSREELIEANNAITERQKNVKVGSADAAPMPLEEELLKLMEELSESNQKTFINGISSLHKVLTPNFD